MWRQYSSNESASYPPMASVESREVREARFLPEIDMKRVYRVMVDHSLLPECRIK